MAFGIYLGVLVLGPILFGAVHTYAYTVVFLGVLCATVLVTWGNIQRDYRTGTLYFQFPSVGAVPGICLGVGVCILQLVPLPVEVVGWVSPKAAFFHQMAYPGGDAGGSWGSLGVYDYPVRQSLVRFCVYGLLFLGMIQVLNSRKRIEMAAAVLLTLMALESVYGIYQTYAGGHRMLWYRDAVNSLAVTGTYINRNHFAGLMELGIILAACFAAAIPVRKEETRTGLSVRRGLMHRMLPYLSGRHGGEKRILVLFLGAVIGIGLILSASRGGMIAAAGGLFGVCILFLFQRVQRRKGYVLLALALVIAVFSSHIGVDYALGRFRGMDADYAVRYRYMQTTLSLFADFPVAGAGIGNFSQAYPRYQAPEDGKLFVDYAHNDWVQFLGEAGIAGMAVLIVGLGCFLADLASKWKKRAHPWAVSLGAIPFGALIAYAIHAYSDFNLHVPANFMVLCAVLAIGYCAACMESGRTGDVLTYRIYRYPLKGRGGVLLAALIALIAWTGSWTLRHAVAEGWCATVENSTLNQEPYPAAENIQRAISWDPWNAQYWFQLGLETDRQQEGQEAAVRAFKEAVCLNPYNSYFHVNLGWAYLHRISDPAEAGKWQALSDESMHRAAYGAGVDAKLQESLGTYWLVRSQALPVDDPDSENFKNKAFDHYDRAIGLLSGKERQAAKERLKR